MILGSAPFSTSIVGSLTFVVVVGLGGVGWRLLVGQNRKLDRIVSYLFTAKTTKDGIPGAPGKLAQQDQILSEHTAQLKKLDRGQVEILRRLRMSNGGTIAEGVEALTSGKAPE